MACLESRSGMAMVAVLLTLLFLSAMAATLAMEVRMDTQLRGAFSQAVKGFYAAESGLNQGIAEFKTKFLTYLVPTGSDFDLRTTNLGDRSVSYQLTSKPGNPQSVTIPAGQLFAGLNSLQYDYTVSSKATNSSNSDIEATVGAEFLVGNIPLFQFVAFYNNDLEIEPGAAMVLQGRIHTNGNLYLNSDASLTIQDDPANGISTVQVSAKGDVYRGRKDNNSCGGTVTIDKLVDANMDGSLDPLVMPCSGGTSMVSVSALSAWKGSIVSEIQSISVPQPDIITHSGTYWAKADLRIGLLLNTPNQLQGAGPWLPATVAVLDATGNVDAAKTALLEAFMADPITAGVYANTAASSMPGTRPVYYTDVPLTNNQLAVAGSIKCTCSNTSPTCNSTNPSCYPQADATNPSVLSTTRYIGCPLGAGTCNKNGEALNAATFNRTYTSNAFPSAMLGDLDYRRGGFYNWREKKWMYLLNVNVSDLLKWNSKQTAGNQLFDNADSSDGGLILYLTVVGPNSSASANNYGVRVFGSADLSFPITPSSTADPTGLTIVSDQAMYIQGNFNQGKPSANGVGYSGNPAGTGLPKQPAAILADSVNILSSAYFSSVGCMNDCQSNLALGSRGAASTWINAGLLSGVDTTTSGNYNGGLENYPRFHENWSGSTLNYWGSFVSLGTPQHVDGDWCGTGTGCNIYNPPNRSYNFDPFFNNVANLPPLTPRFVYVQQVLFTENFQ